ncbi:DUF2271 domain-containing protein [Brevundimonas goettingensis]|uniref:DUF2271 domain-containing protein n=1 Tax=Brevundimonas goettingensis TaxID=2774190 RepID=A0A975C0E3_9CAUL|nr:DUF2271 domain-containing protein [Brevundimonas goettingensis]QTC91438.1 DUF2271 domain-containing protein [Brevundimonas goettingensis]
MRLLPAAALAVTAASAVAAPAMAADLTVTIEVPRLPVAAYHRPYVAVWIENPADQAAVRTLAVWYEQVKPDNEGQTWLKDLRTWWRKGGRAMRMPADGVSGATRAPGRQTITIPAARLSGVAAGQYNLVVEAAREQGGREVVRVPFRWGAPNTGRVAGTSELGAVSVAVSR